MDNEVKVQSIVGEAIDGLFGVVERLESKLGLGGTLSAATPSNPMPEGRVSQLAIQLHALKERIHKCADEAEKL